PAAQRSAAARPVRFTARSAGGLRAVLHHARGGAARPAADVRDKRPGSPASHWCPQVLAGALRAPHARGGGTLAGPARRGPARRPVGRAGRPLAAYRSEEHTSELQSRENLVCRLLLEKK